MRRTGAQSTGMYTPAGAGAKVRPLQLARLYDDLEGQAIVFLLLAAGANPNMVNEDSGLPPIHYAMTHGHSVIMAALVDAGVNLDVAYSDGATLLHHAVERGRASTVTVLLEAGADPNVGDKDGKTPLYWAAWEGSPGPIVALLKGGADHGAADNEGVMPLLVALERNNLAAVELLRGE